MSVLCTKDYTITVGASCAFVLDAANDSISVDNGLAYSPQRQEVLAASGNTAALYPITALTRIGGAKVVTPAVPRFVAWCPSVSKYYIVFAGSTVRSYNPVTSVFGAAIALPANGDVILYVASTDRLYVIVSQRYIIQINPNTDTAATVFDGGAVDLYGHQIAYAPSLNAIVGARLQSGTNSMAGWVFALPGNTMTITPAVGALPVGSMQGATWDSSRGKIWFNEIVGATESFFRVDPVLGLEFTVQFSPLQLANFLTYDAVTDCIYFDAFSGATEQPYKLRLSDNTLHQFTDPSSLFQAGGVVVIANSLFFTGGFRNSDSASGVLSCAVSQFT